MKLLIKFIFLTIAVFVAAHFISGIHIDGVTTALVAGAILTLIQVIIKPIVKILTLPFTIITLGLFAIILNAIFFWFISGLVPGMAVDTFTSAILGSLVVSLFNFISHYFTKKKD